jgi:fumarate reductase subunit D
MDSPRRHGGYWAFVGHRVSGLLLALFLPMHFYVLGTALEGAERLDGLLKFSSLPFVKFAEWGLVVLLCIHFFFGLRLLVLEFFPAASPRNTRLAWVGWGAGLSLAAGVVFAMRAF